MLTLTSAAFVHEQAIPKRYSCEGEDVSPPLKIAGVPKETKSLVLLLEDPDVPLFVRKDRLWIHWVLYDLPPDIKEIKEGAIPSGVVGKNTAGKTVYMGPCPPDREHRYFFKLYALDTKLGLSPGATRDEVLAAMEGHILEKTELMGRYQKEK